MATNNSSISSVIENASIGIKDAESSLFKKSIIGGIFGLIAIIGYSLTIAGIGHRLLFIGLLLSFATFVVGFFTGTLFGMPKRNAANDSDYSLNNSLVEISDWLTKIIVGLSLVNLKEIPIYLLSLGQFVSEASNSTGQSLDVFAMSIVVYSSVLGLYIGYNYMRLVLSQKYKQADDNMLKRELERKDVQTKALFEVANRNATNPNTSIKEGYVEQMSSAASNKLADGLRINQNDPQKGQWGGSSKLNNRQLEAEVKEFAENLFDITIRVKSTDPNKPMEEGEIVLFALHPTFGSPPFRYAMVTNGIAEVKLVSYGSFTVGASADKGVTQLELDLAELANVSDHFKRH